MSSILGQFYPSPITLKSQIRNLVYWGRAVRTTLKRNYTAVLSKSKTVVPSSNQFRLSPAIT